MALSWFRAANLQKLVVFCDFQIARATLCGLWAGRPSKTRGFLRFSIRPRDPLRTLGWSTFENSWFFAIFKSPARPSADFGLVDLRKLVVFLRFSNRPRDPLRTLGWSTFENSWFFAIFNSPARPSAEFGLVDLRKLVVFLRFSNRPRDPLRSLGWSTFENSCLFAISKSPARPSAQFRVVVALVAARHVLAAVNPKPLPSQGDLLQSALDASSKPLPSLWDCF